MHRMASCIPDHKVCQYTYKVSRNRNTILLPHVITNVFAFRVKHVSWLTNPLTAPATNTMLWISCPEIYVNSPNQSGFMLLDPADPTGQQLLVYRKDVIASFNIAPLAAGTPNVNNNDPQQKFNLERLTNLTRLTFEFNADNELDVPITPADDVSVTLEFYLTC